VGLCYPADLEIRLILSSQAFLLLRGVPVFQPRPAFLVPLVCQEAPPCQTLPSVRTLPWLPWIPSVPSCQEVRALQGRQQVRGYLAAPSLLSVLGLL